MAVFPSSAISALSGRNTTGSGVRGSGTNAGGRSKTGNPYELMYRDNYGFIFGKPLAYLPRTDPNQRVFQKTMLRNNTIVNIIPGIPFQDSEMLAKAKEILDDYFTQVERVMSGSESPARTKKLNKLATDVQDKLIKNKCDLRYAVFKQDIAGFMQAYQLMLNRVGTAVFGTQGGLSKFVTENLNLNINESLATRGFKLWVEKGTSISETIDNSYTASVLENAVKSTSALVKQAKFIGQAVGVSNAAMETTEVTSSDANAQAAGLAANIASRTLNGAAYDFPNIFDASKFNRSYEIAFRFVSPRGDDRSVVNYVLSPFLFMLNCATPRQEGPTGHISPFILQVDAPGFFSTPMGVVTSFSFRKGGDEMLFNDRGLPLIIEGSMTINDLYSNLSLPLTYKQFATNFGTSAFLNTLGGLNLYATMDMSLMDTATNWAKDLIAVVIQPIHIFNEEVYKMRRYLGI